MHSDITKKVTYIIYFEFLPIVSEISIGRSFSDDCFVAFAKKLYLLHQHQKHRAFNTVTIIATLNQANKKYSSVF